MEENRKKWLPYFFIHDPWVLWFYVAFKCTAFLLYFQLTNVKKEPAYTIMVAFSGFVALLLHNLLLLFSWFYSFVNSKPLITAWQSPVKLRSAKHLLSCTVFEIFFFCGRQLIRILKKDSKNSAAPQMIGPPYFVRALESLGFPCNNSLKIVALKSLENATINVLWLIKIHHFLSLSKTCTIQSYNFTTFGYYKEMQAWNLHIVEL